MLLAVGVSRRGRCKGDLPIDFIFDFTVSRQNPRIQELTGGGAVDRYKAWRTLVQKGGQVVSGREANERLGDGRRSSLDFLDGGGVVLCICLLDASE